MLYRLCKSMIAKGFTVGLVEKLDVFFAMGKLTQEEYTELSALITPLNRV
ncbi:MAG: hypothetical protein RR653_12955 [Clostridia bacterium]